MSKKIKKNIKTKKPVLGRFDLPKDAKEYYELLVQCAKDGTFPSMKGEMCMYRAEGGEKACAAGLLIPDLEYSEDLERQQVSEIYEYVNAPKGVSWNNLTDIQAAHDNCALRATGWSSEDFIAAISKMEVFQPYAKKS